MDERIGKAIEAQLPWAPRRPIVALPRIAVPHVPIRHPLRVAAVIPVLLALVMLNVVAQTGGGQSFFDREGGYTWTHGQKLELTRTVGGYKVTLHRAYADANLLMLATTVVDVEQQGVWTWTSSVADSSGTEWQQETGGGLSSDSITYFSAISEPAPAGRRTFTVSYDVRSNREHAAPSSLDRDPWVDTTYVHIPISISFDLTVAGGLDTRLNASTVSQGVTMTLDRITTAPAMVRLTLHLRGAFPAGSDGWLPIAFVTHNGRDVPVRNESAPLREDGQSATDSVVVIETNEGVDDPSGDWSVTASELTGNATEPGASWGHDVRLAGSWTLNFTLP